MISTSFILFMLKGYLKIKMLPRITIALKKNNFSCGTILPKGQYLFWFFKAPK